MASAQGWPDVLNFKKYLYELHNIFVQISKCGVRLICGSVASAQGWPGAAGPGHVTVY